MQARTAADAVPAWPPAARPTAERDGVRVYADAPENIPGLLSSGATGPARPALAAPDGRSLSLAELWERAGSLAAGLQHRYEVAAGDRVALLFANDVEFCIALIAALRAGAAGVPLNTKYSGPQLAALVADAGAKVLLGAAEWWGQLEPYRARTPLAHVALTGATATDRLDDVTGAELDEPARGPGDAALVVYTSGTTGSPKGAVLTHGNVVQAALTYARCLDLGPDDSTVVSVPLFHVTGLIGQLLPVVASGGSALLLPRFDAKTTAELLSAAGATFFHAAPSVYVLVLAAAGGSRARGLRLALCGGGAISPATIEDVRRFAPDVDFRTVYGLTETSSPATLMPAGWLDRKPGSSGVAVPVADLGVDAPAGLPGEVLVAGTTVADGYFRQPEATARVFRDGWLHTGDVGVLDGDGFLTIVDRLKDMINRGGEKVASLEVERVLYGHPGVAECAVVGRPDPVYGEVPVAYVVPSGDLDAADLRDFAAARLAKFEVPADFRFVTTLPRNEAGKILKQTLREEDR